MRVTDSTQESLVRSHATFIRGEFVASLDGHPGSLVKLEQRVRLLTRDGLVASLPIERLIVTLKYAVDDADTLSPARTSSVSQDPHVELLESMVKWVLDEYFATSASLHATGTRLARA